MITVALSMLSVSVEPVTELELRTPFGTPPPTFSPMVLTSELDIKDVKRNWEPAGSWAES